MYFVLLEPPIERGATEAKSFGDLADVAGVVLERFQDHRSLDLVHRHAANGRQGITGGVARLHIRRGSEVLGLEDAALGDQERPLDGLPQLSDVPRPWLRLQPGDGPGVQAKAVAPVYLRERLQKAAREQWDVIAALT